MTRLILPDAAQATTPMNVPAVFFHHPCADGFTAAWAFWTKFPDWEYIAATHGDLADMVSTLNEIKGSWMGEDIYFLDICPQKDALTQVLDLVHTGGKKVYVLDHHKSALDFLTDMEHPALVKFCDNERSGAGLAWDYVYGDSEPRPDLVNFVEDRDLWRFKLEDTRVFASFLFSLEYDFMRWDLVHRDLQVEEHREAIFEQGEAITRKHYKDTAELVANGHDWQVIGGWEVPTINAPYFYASELGHALCKEVPFAAVWYERQGQRHYSLRSEENVGLDVSKIAQMYGGGGHRHAAGFSIACPVLNDLSEYVIGPDGVPYSETRRDEA